MDLASVIGATYLLSVAKQRRKRTSKRLLPDRSNFAAHCRVIEGFNDEDVSQISHEEAWSDVLQAGRMVQAGMTLGQFPSAFIGDKS